MTDVLWVFMGASQKVEDEFRRLLQGQQPRPQTWPKLFVTQNVDDARSACGSWPSRCLSIRPMPVLCLNECTYIVTPFDVLVEASL